MLGDFMPTVATLGDVTAQKVIPAEPLRKFFDGMFPSLAECRDADFLAGKFHRWRGGHDLLLDVLPRVGNDPAGALHHAGHVLLTDFPTKDGIPIPGLSMPGLGDFLKTKLEISSPWLSVNAFNTVFGSLAVWDGTSDLSQAIDGSLKPCLATFWDTFGEGAMEAAGAVASKNPLLLAAAIENISAGCIVYGRALIKELAFLSGQIDGDAVLQSAFCSLLLGSSLATLIEMAQGKPIKSSTLARRGGKSALVGALGTICTGFSIGAALGFAVFHLGKKYAARQNKRFLSAQDISPEVLAIIIKDNMQNEAFHRAWGKTYVSMDAMPVVELPELPVPQLPYVDAGMHLKAFFALPYFSVDTPEMPPGIPTIQNMTRADVPMPYVPLEG